MLIGVMELIGVIDTDEPEDRRNYLDYHRVIHVKDMKRRLKVKENRIKKWTSF